MENYHQNQQDFCKISKSKIKCSKHLDQKIKYICLNKDCKESSRFLCQYCIKSHKDNDYFVNIKEIENKELGNIFNFPISKNQKEYRQILQECYQENSQPEDNSNENQFKKIIEVVRNYFSEFVSELMDMIQKSEKQIILKLEKEYERSKFNKDNFLWQMEETFNLQNLRNIFKSFAGMEASELKTNKQITEYLDKCYEKEDNNQILQRIIKDTVNIDMSQEKLIQNLDKKRQSCIKEVDKFLNSRISLQIRNSLQFHAANYQASKQHINIQDNVIKFTNSGTQYKVMYSEVFKRTQEVSLRFKLDCNGTFEQDFFVFGVVQDGKEENGHNYGPDGGNYFMVNGHDGHTSDKPSELIGEALKDFYKDGIELCVDILVDQDKFEMYDIERKSVRKNKHVFRKTDDWRFIISAPRGITPTFTFM